IEFLRRLEQHARRVLRFARGRRGGPARVARGELEFARMLSFVREPCGHLAREVELGEIATEELPGGRLRIEARDIGGLHLVQGTALYELPLHRIERRELVVALCQGARLALDAKQLGDEILDLRRECDEEL